MRLMIAFIAIFLSWLGAYQYNKGLKKTLEYNAFYLDLAHALVSNNQSEMLSFEEVFIKVYKERFCDISFDNKESALKFLENEMNEAVDNTAILKSIRAYLLSGQGEISASGDALIDITQRALDIAKKRINELGKSVMVLCPGLVMLVLIIFI